jgi:hypothetical protein
MSAAAACAAGGGKFLPEDATALARSSPANSVSAVQLRVGAITSGCTGEVLPMPPCGCQRDRQRLVNVRHGGDLNAADLLPAERSPGLLIRSTGGLHTFSALDTPQ